MSESMPPGMDLTEIEEQLLAAWKGGDQVGFVPHANTVADWSGRIVSAEALRFILRQPELDPRTPIAGYRISGQLGLSGVEIGVPIRFIGCLFEQPMIANDATIPRLEIACCRLPYLWAERVHVGSDIDLVGSEFFDGLQGISVNLDRARVGASVKLSGIVALGALRLVGARVDGQLASDGGNVGAIEADQADIAGGVMLLGGFVANRGVRMLGARIGGQFRAGGARFTDGGDGALVLDQAEVHNGVFLNSGFHARGGVRLAGARIGGQFDATGGQFFNPGANAIDMSGADIRVDIDLDHGFVSHGNVNLIGVRVGGDVLIRGATLDGGDDYALQLNRSAIAGSLAWLPDAVVGRVSFIQATATGLLDSPASWPQSSTWDLDGFTYQRFLNEKEPLTVSQRRRWLARQAEYARWPYKELARVYRSLGRDGDATKILMEEHNVLLRRERSRGPVADDESAASAHPVRTRVRRFRQAVAGRGSKAYRWFTRATIGHGFQPLRAIGVAVAIIAITSFAVSHERRNIVSTDSRVPSVSASAPCVHARPCFQPLVFAIDTVVPIVSLGQRDAWHPAGDAPGWLSAMLWTDSIIGWILATVVAIGLTSVIRRE